MNARKRMSTGAVVAAVALLGGAIFGGTADAQKKKKKGGGSATVTKTVNAPVPDAIGNGVEKVLDGKLATTLTVGKAGKNKSIGRVAVTLQTTGLAAGAAGDLDANITAPDGTTVGLFGGLAGQSIGPLTIQPNSPFEACSYNPATQVPPPPPCDDPDETVNAPYVGTVGNAGLNLLNGGRMKGNYIVNVYDRGYAIAPDPALTSIVNSIRLQVTAAKAPK